VRKTPDVVSSEIRVQKRWRGCDSPVQFQRDSKNKGIFLDVGANIGSCSLAALAAGATVIAFEPLPSNLYYFHHSMNSAPPFFRSRLTLYPVALGSQRKNETIYTEPGNAGNSALQFPTRAKREHANVVRIVPLDDVIRAPIAISVMKMDVQGYEIHVLEGASRLLASKSIQVIQTEISTEWLKNLGRAPSQLCRLLVDSGYDLFEEACVGTVARSVLKGRPLTQEKCKQWDRQNAECDIVARLRK
jgi:FkbM family methyltransferase